MSSAAEEFDEFWRDLQRARKCTSDAAMTELVNSILQSRSSRSGSRGTTTPTVSRDTIRRIRTRKPVSQKFLTRVGQALDCERMLTDRWEALRQESSVYEDLEFTRGQVRTVWCSTLSAEQMSIEVSSFLGENARQFDRPRYFGVVASADRRRALQKLNPLDLVSVNAVADELELKPLDISSPRIQLARVHEWFDQIAERLRAAVELKPSDQLIETLDNHLAYLHGDGANPGVSRARELRRVTMIAVLAGRIDRDARIDQAVKVYGGAANPPQIILFGAPPRSESESKLGEADMAWHALQKRLERGDVEIPPDRVVVDQRVQSFRDAAGLMLGHLLSPSALPHAPHTVAVVAGAMSTRRPWWLFSQALLPMTHVVRSVLAAAAETSASLFNTFPIQGTLDARHRWATSIIAETEKLVLTRLAGEA